MQDVTFYNGPASLDGNVYSSILSFISLFLCSLIRSLVHTECMCLIIIIVMMIKQRHMQVLWKTHCKCTISLSETQVCA